MPIPLQHCPCSSVTRSIVISLTYLGAGTPPQFNYRVRWRTVAQDLSKSDYVEQRNVPFAGGTYTLTGIPSCCKVEIDVSTECEFGVFGTPQIFNVEPLPVTSTAIQYQGCGNGGVGIYHVTGPRLQRVELRLLFQGNFQHNGVNGQCAFLFGEIQHIKTTIGGVEYVDASSSSYSKPVTTLENNVPLLDPPKIFIDIPDAGYAVIRTKLIGYNVSTLSATTGTLEVLSLNGSPVANVQQVISCRITDTNSTLSCGGGNQF